MGQQKAKFTSGKSKTRKLSPTQAKTLRWVIGFVVAFAILIVLGLAVSNDWFDGFGPACTVGDVEISKEEYSFNFNSNYSSFVSYYSSYISSLGLDTSSPLDEQQYDEDRTWKDYFDEQTRQSLADTIALSEVATAKGVTLSEENLETVDNYVDSIKSAAKSEGVSLGAYTKSVFGRKLSVEEMRSFLSRILLAQQYADVLFDSYEISDDQITEQYNNNKDTYDTVSYRVLTVVADIPDQDTMSDDEYALVTKEAMETAENAANDLIESMKDSSGKVTEDLFAEKALAYSESLLDEDSTDTVSIDDSLVTVKGISEVSDTEGAEWLFDESRDSGDCEVIEGTEEYTIYYFIERVQEDYNVVTIRHILVPFNDDMEEAQSTAEDDEAKASCESIKAEFVEKGATEDVFIALAQEKGTDSTQESGGLLEDVSKGDLVSEFEDWCFDSARQPGDYDIIKTQYGYHLVYFSSTGDIAWKVAAEADVRQNLYDTDYTELLLKYPVYVDGQQVYIYEADDEE